MDSVLTALGTGASAAALTTACVNLITILYPRRHSAVALGSALILGVIWSAVFAMRDIPLTDPWTRIVWANIIIGGVTAGIAAAGLSVVQASAEAKRAQAKQDDFTNSGGGTSGTAADAQLHGEPDPMNPITQVQPTPPVTESPFVSRVVGQIRLWGGA